MERARARAREPVCTLLNSPTKLRRQHVKHAPDTFKEEGSKLRGIVRGRFEGSGNRLEIQRRTPASQQPMETYACVG